MGKTLEAQERNRVLLSGYDYAKYPAAITGYTGQDLQTVMTLRYHDAVRTRVGPRGNYKAGMTRLADGTLLIAVCRQEANPEDPAKRVFQIYVYESSDKGLTWREIAKPGIIGKEPSLTILPDGGVLLTAQHADFTKSVAERGMHCSLSQDGGRTWELRRLANKKYPRNVIVDKDGSLLFLRSTDAPRWNLELCRSRDAGRNWTFAEGRVDWDEKDRSLFDEVSAIRLEDRTLLAALRREIPGSSGEGFEDTMATRSDDDGKTWSRPTRMVRTAEVHVYLTILADGRVLATHSNYHLPYGVNAVLSEDGGRTWDLDHPILLALSADLYVGWPVTLQLPDGSLITSYASTSYVKEPPDTTTCEVVRWRLPEPLRA
ncbi:MAG: sialidase family protein [Planctomycetota bacterium]